MQGCASGLIGQEPVVLSSGLQQLKNEHPPLLDLLDGLLFLCNKIENDIEKSNTFEQLTFEVPSFFKKLEFHSEREEDYLFRMMEMYMGKGMGPIAVMEYEHEQAKGCINLFLEKVNGESIYTNEEMLEYSSLIKRAYYILVDHFAKEENVLYPMAEKILSEDEKEELAEKLFV